MTTANTFAAYKTNRGWISKAPWYITICTGGQYRLSRKPQLFSNEIRSDQRFIEEATGYYESLGYSIHRFDLAGPQHTNQGD